MARIVEANKEQRGAISSIVYDDVAELPLRDFGEILAASPQLVVHDGVGGPISQDISCGLPQSPHEYLVGSPAVFLSGARELGAELASRLARILASDSQKTLYIPHAYAAPAEIDSIQDEFEGNAAVFAGRVYIRFAGQHVDPELVRGAFARMIGCYSVAWLLEGNLPDGKAHAAIVSIFDGEGWALVGNPVFPAKLYVVE